MGAYSVAEAARYLLLAPATLRSWVKGRPFPRRVEIGFSPPLIQVADPAGGLLSFNNLIEAHVLRALRTQHGVPMHAVRTAIETAQARFGIERLLLSDKLKVPTRHESAVGRRAGVGAMFLEEYGRLTNLSAGGQLVLRNALNAHLERVGRDSRGLPVRLFPFLPEGRSADRLVVIDPRVSFGRPVLARRGVRVLTLVERYEAGETIEHLAENYDLEASEVEEAIVYYLRAA